MQDWTCSSPSLSRYERSTLQFNKLAVISRSFETYVEVSICFRVTLGFSLANLLEAMPAIVSMGNLLRQFRLLWERRWVWQWLYGMIPEQFPYEGCPVGNYRLCFLQTEIHPGASLDDGVDLVPETMYCWLTTSQGRCFGWRGLSCICSPARWQMNKCIDLHARLYWKVSIRQVVGCWCSARLVWYPCLVRKWARCYHSYWTSVLDMVVRIGHNAGFQVFCPVPMRLHRDKF